MLFYYASLSSDVSNACYLGLLLCLIKCNCLIFQEKDKRVTWVLSLVTVVGLGWKAIF